MHLVPRRVAVGRLRTAPALLTVPPPGMTPATDRAAFASTGWVCLEWRAIRFGVPDGGM